MNTEQFFNLDRDNELGGNNPSNHKVPSQKALKEYIDNKNVLPLCYGIWSEQPLTSDEWHVVDGLTSLSADDYPEMWDHLTAVLNGTKTSEDIDVISSTQVSSITSGNEDWEIIAGQQRLAYCYILDLTNRTFTLPRCISTSLCIGKCEHIVTSGSSNYAGEYSITNYGNYIETSFLVRLEKATKTVTKEVEETNEITGETETVNQDVTYTYYKPTQWNDSESVIETEYNTDNFPCVIFTEPLISTLKKELVNNKYVAFIQKALPCENQDGSEPIQYYLTDNYYSFLTEETKTNTTYSVNLKLYDEEYKYCNSDLYKKIMTDDESSVLLCYHIHGFTIPPTIAEYTTNKRLYIKVK